MLNDSPAFLTVAEILRLLIASFIAGAGGWFARRKKEPAEIAKLKAEARSIDVSTDLSLMRAAGEALTNSLRVVEQRDHWQRKAGDLLQEVKGLEDDAHLNELQMKKMTAHRDVLRIILEEHQIPFPDWDGKWNGSGLK